MFNWNDLLPKPENPTEHWRAEVQCRSCGNTQWVPWADRHKGMERERNAEGAIRVRCRSCPVNKDWTFWTGRRKESD